MPQIWYRKSKQAYYLQIDRHTQKRLGKSKAEAEAAYRTWLIEQGGQLPVRERRKLTIAEATQEFLDYAKAHTKPKTYEFYCYFLVPFVEKFGGATATDFSPLAFNKWLDAHAGWKGSRRNAIVAVRRLFNWCIENKLLAENPVRSVKKPAKRRRKRFLSADEKSLLLGAIRDRYFREYCFAMLETERWPMEVARVTANDVTADCTRWTLSEHKTDRHGDDRIIYLSPAMQDLTRRLVAENPSGPIFRSLRRRNGVRQPFSGNGIRCRFKLLRKKHPELAGVTAYVLRHSFATAALLNGVEAPKVSALLGHKSLGELDTYSHVAQAADELATAARRATACARR